MQRVLVMRGVTGPEVNVAVPAPEREHPQERPIQPSGLEHRVVHQFVKAVHQEAAAGAVYGEQEQHQRPGQPAHRPHGNAPGHHQHGEVAQRLEVAQHVAAPVQRDQRLPAQRRPIPRDPARSSGGRVPVLCLTHGCQPITPTSCFAMRRDSRGLWCFRTFRHSNPAVHRGRWCRGESRRVRRPLATPGPGGEVRGAIHVSLIVAEVEGIEEPFEKQRAVGRWEIR